jgi:hypothetical protein
MAAIKIPDELKVDAPQTAWGKTLLATPVVMTVIATMLAGLASSEMTRAQYDRALGAQRQSKAGDQWSFFQAKKLRGALQRNALDLLQSSAELHPLDADRLKGLVQSDAEAVALLGSPAGEQTAGFLQRGEIPALKGAADPDPKISAALEAIDNLKPDAEVASLLSSVTDQMLDDAVRAAKERADGFDTLTTPINKSIDQFDKAVGAPGVPQDGRRDFTAARLRYATARYEAEARLNQTIASLFELQVRKSNISAERHHARSQRFFYGMLAAQMAVIVSTFAIAARQRNLLWTLAAAAGVVAIAVAIYVYLFV